MAVCRADVQNPMLIMPNANPCTARLVGYGLQLQRSRHPGTPAGGSPVCRRLRTTVRPTVGCLLLAVFSSTCHAGFRVSDVQCRWLNWQHVGRPVGCPCWLRRGIVSLSIRRRRVAIDAAISSAVCCWLRCIRRRLSRLLSRCVTQKTSRYHQMMR